MRAYASFLCLLFSCFLALPAKAQVSNTALASETNLASGLPKYQEVFPQPEASAPFPFMALSMALFVLLIVSPFAIRYFGDMTQEMRAAQKGSGSSRTKR